VRTDLELGDFERNRSETDDHLTSDEKAVRTCGGTTASEDSTDEDGGCGQKRSVSGQGRRKGFLEEGGFNAGRIRGKRR
jgi:hypothetical protein